MEVEIAAKEEEKEEARKKQLINFIYSFFSVAVRLFSANGHVCEQMACMTFYIGLREIKWRRRKQRAAIKREEKNSNTERERVRYM